MIEKRVYIKDLTVAQITIRLNEGEILFDEAYPSHKYRMVNGILTRTNADGSTMIGSCIFSDDNNMYFIDTQASVIDHVGSYQTRDGRVAFISLVLEDKNVCHGAVEGIGKHCTWCLDGSAKSGGESDIDIVGEIK